MIVFANYLVLGISSYSPYTNTYRRRATPNTCPDMGSFVQIVLVQQYFLLALVHWCRDIFCVSCGLHYFTTFEIVLLLHTVHAMLTSNTELTVT